jgi:ribose transport system ATP-binding protein
VNRPELHATADTFLMLEGITKTYPGVVALDDVSFAIAPGEVVGLVGENGAGKSTLMKILGGVVEPTAGSIRLAGSVHSSLSVADAIKAGIAFVHQELNLFDNLDVTANVFIGREILRGGPLRLVDSRRMIAAVQPILDMLGVDFKPDTQVATLAIAQRQLLEIAKALSQNARVVIMDEPTSSLTLAETARLLRVIARLKAEGVSIIFISHRLGELSECADRVVVLRDGRVVGELQKDEISHSAMIRLMIGRELKALYTAPAGPAGEPVLDIIDARTSSYPDRAVNLSLRKGEILGLAGLVGSGRTELAQAIFGIEPLSSGRIRVEGHERSPRSPRDAIEMGIFLVPEDRKRFGLLLDLSIAENIALADLHTHAHLGIIRAADIQQNGARQQSRLGIRAVSLASMVGALSGGNQQKVVLAKWLSLDPKVLICDEPTRGIDVGAKQDIYSMLRKLADAGVAILMISSDMEEVIGVSDRIAVMHEGRISGILERPQFSEHNILLLAVGEPLH